MVWRAGDRACPSVIPPQVDRGTAHVMKLRLASRLSRRAVANGYSREKPESPHVWHVYPSGSLGLLCDRLAGLGRLYSSGEPRRGHSRRWRSGVRRSGEWSGRGGGRRREHGAGSHPGQARQGIRCRAASVALPVSAHDRGQHEVPWPSAVARRGELDSRPPVSFLPPHGGRQVHAVAGAARQDDRQRRHRLRNRRRYLAHAETRSSASSVSGSSSSCIPGCGIGIWAARCCAPRSPIRSS